MSIVFGVIVRNLNGDKEMIFASDGRILEHGTGRIRNEDYAKTKRLGPQVCIGYAGQSGELFEDVSQAMGVELRRVHNDAKTVSRKLRQVITDMLETQRHAEIEASFGPLNHCFMLGAVFDKKPKINVLLSSEHYRVNLSELEYSTNVVIRILGSSEEIQKKASDICRERLGHAQGFDEIVANIRFAVSMMAKSSRDINDHIFIRRLSTGFSLESYVG
jgi:hypothetical protein